MTNTLRQLQVAIVPSSLVYVAQERDNSATPGSKKLIRIDPTSFDPGDPFANQTLIRQGALFGSVDGTALAVIFDDECCDLKEKAGCKYDGRC